VDTILSIAGEAVVDSAPVRTMFPNLVDLYALLSERNGFYALESALHVFPSAVPGVPGRSLEEWNDPELWLNHYGPLRPKAVCFAEDAFGGQFLIKDGAVLAFNPETGDIADLAPDLSTWMQEVLIRFNYLAGYTVAHEWQLRNGALPVGHRLIPRVPFSCGGEFVAENVVPVEAVAAMRYWGNFAQEISALPDGTPLRFNPAVVDKLICGRWSNGGDCRCFA
jgi:hypothetical protein